MEEVVFVPMEKELDEPFYICHDGRWLCVYIDVEADYKVVLSDDIETGYIEADSITEEDVIYYIAGFCDVDSGVEYSDYSSIEKLEKSLTKEERELMQAFAEKNSGFSDDDIINKAINEI